MVGAIWIDGAPDGALKMKKLRKFVFNRFRETGIAIDYQILTIKQVIKQTKCQKYHLSTMETTNTLTHKLDIIVHRLPTCESFITSHLDNNYSLIDPISVVGANPATVQRFLRDNCGGVRALVCVKPIPLGKDIMDCLPSLECVVSVTAGTDHIELQECRCRGISIANLGDAFSDDVADYAVGLLLDVLKGVSAGERFVRAGLWTGQREFSLGVRLSEKREGIVGLGNIGHRVARRLLPFGCSMAYNSKSNKPNISFPNHSNIHELALNSDILILCCSLTAETRHMVNKDVLQALGKEGIIINVGRGSLISEKELVEFLFEGKIVGAGLDVFEDEPNVPKELFGLENVVLSAHHAVCTPESFKAVIDVVVRNLEAFFSNNPLLNAVRLE